MAATQELRSPGKFTFAQASRGLWVALTDGATITPDCLAGDFQSVTLGGNRTLAAPLNAPNNAFSLAARLVFRIRQDATGSRTLTWNAIYRFPSGVTPILTTGANKTDYFHFMYNENDSKWDCIGDRYNL